ncbi:hypothetical protein EIP91_011619, partial [Steccherinum ochraceum]
MAKLLHPLPSSSRPTLLFPAQRHHHPRRRRPPARRKLPLSTPSTAVLAALATISAASSTVDGHPLDDQPPPPDFLCPSYPSDYIPAQTPPPSVSTSRRRNTRRDFATPSVNTPSKRDSRPSVPLKYEQGEDGRWRKSSSYSLLGSSFCGTTQCVPQDTDIPVVDDQIQPSQSATVTTTADDSDMSSYLPPGWPSKSNDDRIPTPVIVGLSIVLAVIICGFMVGCIFWRKQRRKRARDMRDLEEKRKSKLYDEDSEDEENEDIKRARSQQR